MKWVLAAVVVGTIALVPAASAEVVAGRPDESIAQAYPLRAGVAYQGAFDNTSYDDVDYLSFTVARAGETLAFTVANTTPVCNDPNGAGCPVYATLIDQTDNQVGGASSAAGTIATFADLETFDWTFSQPGTYYLLMESNGDEAPGNPSYAVSFTPASGAGGGGGGGGGRPLPPLVRSLRVLPRQHGGAVRASVTLGRSASSIRLWLSVGGRVIARLARRSVMPGLHRLKLTLDSYERRVLASRGRLTVTLRIAITGAAGGSRTFNRRVILRR